LPEPSDGLEILWIENGVGVVEGLEKIDVELIDWDNVGPVSSGTSLSGISIAVVVGHAPLEEDVVTNGGVKDEGNKVVLKAVSDLGDVSSLSTDVHVVDSLTAVFGRLTPNNEGVGTVLENATELSGVNGHAER